MESCLFYLIFIFIFLIRRKATEALIHRAGNYPDCFLRYQDIAVCLKFNKNMRTACQDHQAGESAVKCLFLGHNRTKRVGFESRLCRLRTRRSNLSTSLPAILKFKNRNFGFKNFTLKNLLIFIHFN